MPRPSPAILLAFLGACGGLRGDSARVEPHAGQLTVASRVDVPHVRVQSSLQLTAAAAPLAVATTSLPPVETSVQKPEMPSFDAVYPLYGVAFHMLAQVYSEPSDKAIVTGYLRRGALLRAKPGVRGRGCDTLWHALYGGGYVCAGRGFTLGKTPQRFEPSPAAPVLHDDLPYPYEKTLARDVPQYFRAPSPSEERDTLLELSQLKTAAVAQASDAARKGESAMLGGKLAGQGSDAATATPALPKLVRMVMQPGFYVSVDGREVDEDGERELVRTVRGAYVRGDALAEVGTPVMHGVVLREDLSTPLALVNRASAPAYLRNPETAQLVKSESLPLMRAFRLTGSSLIHSDKRRYLLTAEGLWVPEDALTRVQDAVRPPLVPSRARWIDISLGSQTLVAYEGKTPVFATLVSTGKEGHDTPTGIFRIQSKHVSATMDGEAGADEAYSIEDVPWTMYFQGNYALHAAFWHKQFGHVRSHGCVNLAPADARHLFEWSTPTLPGGFHGVISTRDNQGTFVVIHP